MVSIFRDRGPLDVGGNAAGAMVSLCTDGRRGWIGTRAHDEVGCFETGSDPPTWVRETDRPGSVLRADGVHPTDIQRRRTAEPAPATTRWTGLPSGVQAVSAGPRRAAPELGVEAGERQGWCSVRDNR